MGLKLVLKNRCNVIVWSNVSLGILKNFTQLTNPKQLKSS